MTCIATNASRRATASHPGVATLWIASSTALSASRRRSSRPENWSVKKLRSPRNGSRVSDAEVRAAGAPAGCYNRVVASPSVRGPFRPGTGATPPYLAGRELPQSMFQEFLTDLSNGLPPGTQIILHGPRGNGKTALLRWLHSEATHAFGIETAVLRPAEIRDASRLGELVASRRWWHRLAPAGFSLGQSGWTRGRIRPPSPAEILATRARRKPLLVLLDEAHTLDLDVGRILLNAAQETGGSLPLLLVLAGTPGLEGRLNAMGASFWNRAEQLRIGRLSEEATAEAFSRPFRDEGIEVSGDALTVMVRESQRYPYFVQLLGSAVWGRLGRSGAQPPRVTGETVGAARREFDRTKGEYYAHRVEEMAVRGLLSASAAVADAFRDRSTLTRSHLEKAIERGLGGAGDAGRQGAAMQELRELGYIWRVEARPDWEPGIPSLMDYVREHARES